MIAPRPMNQLTTTPSRPQALVEPVSDISVARVDNAKRIVETTRAHGLPGLHFHAIQRHSTVEIGMRMTAAAVSRADSLAVPWASVTRETKPTIPLIRYTQAPAYI